MITHSTSSTNADRRTVNILLIDDCQTDAVLTQEALLEADVNSHLVATQDGSEALAMLEKGNAFPNGQQPDIILLDLNMPRMDGREILKRIKSDERTKEIAVLILTTSKADTDIQHTYELQANCYLTKPVDFDTFCHLIKSIIKFWCPTAIASND